MSIRVFAQYGEWPPVGEVVVVLGEAAIRLDPDNADVVGNALLAYAASAREMTAMVEKNPRLALGIHATGGGGRC